MADPPASQSPEPPTVFLSYSRNDQDAATLLCAAIERAGPKVFKDDKSTRASELWLNRQQDEIERCGAFVVLVGRDGVQRWIDAEVGAALRRSISARDDATRLPIFPVLLDGTDPARLPPFLRLRQATQWNGSDTVPESLVQDIRDRALALVPATAVPFAECPYVGLAAFQPNETNLFFGRQRETLDALACFKPLSNGRTIRWLEINGNSGSGKSSLMNAGLLPLIDQGLLWPRTGFAQWQLIGPLMPGQHPVAMLAEHLARTFKEEMADIRKRLADGDEALADWLRTRKRDSTAFLLAIDQFEELFTFTDPAERGRFDRLLAAALGDADCPLFVLSTVRADFLDRFEDLPSLVGVRNRMGIVWTLAPIGEDGLREVIVGPARLAGLDVREVETAILAEAQDELGALPLVENVLHWLWQERESNRLIGRKLTEMGGIAGILSRGADDLLDGLEPWQRDRALELLFRLVKVDPEGRRHTRRRIAHAEAVAVAGGGEGGHALVARLAGERRRDGGAAQGPLRLITVTEPAPTEGGGAGGNGRCWVNLIHETLIRGKPDAAGKPLPYWPTLWEYIERHKVWSALRDHLQADMQVWHDKQEAPAYLWSHERVHEVASVLEHLGVQVVLSEYERKFLGPIEAAAVLAEIEHPDTSHRRRAFLGERLDVLGDKRPGVGVDEDGTPDIKWCTIPGGRVAMRVKRRLFSGTGLRPKLVDSFDIARYPVTVAQFRAFLEAKDGWANPAWWADDLYRDPDGNTYDVGRFGNHPAVYVNWFDAMAFCRWLSPRQSKKHKRRIEVRLADEWEWQQAATGGNAANVYPWGGEWDAVREPHRANTFESRVGAATAAGLYPAGKSSQEVYDLAGTVWEWCLNKFDHPEVIRSRRDDFDPRVLRGGSWNYSQDVARSAIRYGVNPYDRNPNIGFRVVCSSPIAGF